MDKLPQINVLSIFRSKYEKDWNSFVHSHNFTEIMTVVGGKGQISTDKNTYSLSKGDIVIINPLIPHFETSDKSEPLEYIIISLDKITIEQPEETDGGDATIIKVQDSSYKTLEVTLSLWRELLINTQDLPLMAISGIASILVFLSRNCRLKVNNIEDELIRAPRIAAVDYLRNHIKTHYATSISLTEIAAKFYISKQYLISKFKKEFGVTPIQFLTNERIRQAKYLLKHADLNITQIGITVGFFSSAYFTKIFKRETGQSPSAFKTN